MKSFLFCIAMTLSIIPVYGQKDKPVPPQLPRNETDEKVYYMEIIAVDDVAKEELYKRARIWIKEFYKNPAGFSQETDSLGGKITLKPQFATYKVLKNDTKAQSAIVKYTLELGFKDGKYRYEISDVNLKAPSYFPIEKLFNESDPNVVDNFNTLTEAGKSFDELIRNLKSSMLEPSVKPEKDEWDEN